MPATPGLAPVFQQYFGGSGSYPLNQSIPSYDYSPGASQATAFNLAGGENQEALTNRINSLLRSGQSAALGARIPNATGLETQSSANIGSELQGQLPADVLANLRQQAAERGVATGSPGSPNSDAAYLRALGLTSLDLTQTGESNLTAALARNPAAPIFDPSTQLISPYQGAGLGLQGGQLGLEYENMLQQNRLRQQQLAMSGGRGGGGGQPAPATDPSAYVRQPFASDLQTTFVSQSPYTGVTGSQDPTTAWLQSISYNPNIGATSGTGTTEMYDSFGNLLPGSTNYNPVTQSAPQGPQSTDQSGGPEGQ